VIKELLGTLRVGPGGVVAGIVATTVGLPAELPEAPAAPGSVQDPPPPPPHPDRILIKTVIIATLTRNAFCEINLFIKPPFEKLLTT
jgi:hypothetical protein